MLKKEDFFKIGTVQKPHGIKGEVVLRFDREIADEIEEQNIIFIEIDGGLVPFFISNVRVQSLKSAIVLFQLARTENEIREIIGKQIYLENLKRDEIESSEPDLMDISGFKLFDENRNQIGIIKQLVDYTENPLLEITPLPIEQKSSSGKKEILIPFNEDLIIAFNRDEKWLQMNLPEGLLEL